MNSYLQRLPTWAQIIPVYAVIVLVIYTWTIISFIWKLTGWLLFLNGGEILTVLAYALATALVESLLVLLAPLVMALALPRRWFSDFFVPRGSALVIVGLGYLMLLAGHFQQKEQLPKPFLQYWSLSLVIVACIFLVHLSVRISFVRRTLELVSDRAKIFLYLWIPLSIASVGAILVRSVLG